MITVPFLLQRMPTVRSVGGVGEGRVEAANVHFRPFGDVREPYVTYPELGRTRYGVADRTLRRTPYARTWQLAKRLRAGAETPFEYILRVDAYLQEGFGYSERPQAPAPGRMPLDAFLIDTKEGYCQHFSGAMALLLRMGGIPARVATGFSPGGFSERRDAWIVRDTDAHAWVEAWYDELGWVTYDPTPDATPARSQIAALEPPPAPASSSAAADEGLTGEGGASGGRPGGVRPDLLLDPQRNNPAEAPAEAGAGIPWWTWPLAGLALARRGLRAAARAGAAAPARPPVAARPRGRRARGRAPPRRPAAAAGHDAAPARGAAGRLVRRHRVPARLERLALRPGARAPDTRPAPGAPARPGPGAGAGGAAAGILGAAAAAALSPANVNCGH